MSGPIQQFEKLQQASEFLFIVYFRGHWCPFCMLSVKNVQNLSASIRDAGGLPVIVTSEDEQHMAATLSKTGYKGDYIVDPEHLLAKELKRQNLVDVAISNKNGYPHGMAQPAILILKKGEAPIFSWAIKPSIMNLGGATDRPNLEQVWEDARAILQNKQAVPRQGYSKVGFMSLLLSK